MRGGRAEDLGREAGMRRLSRGDKRREKYICHRLGFSLSIYMAGDGPLGHMDHVGPKRNLKRAEIERPILAVTGPDREKRISPVFVNFGPKF
jgi:hypothetical protein